MRLKAVKGLFVPLNGIRLNLVEFSSTLEEHTKGEPGLAIKVLEGGHHLKFWARNMLENDPLRFHDLDKDALVFIIDAIGTMHDELPSATRPQVKLLESICKALRPPPLLR
jgi:hypothetical protein